MLYMLIQNCRRPMLFFLFFFLSIGGQSRARDRPLPVSLRFLNRRFSRAAAAAAVIVIVVVVVVVDYN